MRSVHLVVPLAATFAIAGDSGKSSIAAGHLTDYTSVDDLCYPVNTTTKTYDYDVPCNAASYVGFACMYANNQTVLSLLSNATTLTNTNVFKHTPQANNVTQRDCICESQYFNLAMGCNDCFAAHGSDRKGGQFTNEQWPNVSSAYCAASATPTVGLNKWMDDYFNSLLWAPVTETAFAFTMGVEATSTATGFTKVVADRTDVSLYWTPSVTGSAAWLSVATTYPSVDTVSGEIVPTASVNVKVAATSSTKSGNDAGARQTVAVAAIMGVAGVVAML